MARPKVLIIAPRIGDFLTYLVVAEIDKIAACEWTSGLLQPATRDKAAEVDGFKSKALISPLMNSFGSELSPETKITRRPPFFAGPSLKRSVTIELNAFTIRAPDAKAATTSLAPLSPRSASPVGADC